MGYNSDDQQLTDLATSTQVTCPARLSHGLFCLAILWGPWTAIGPLGAGSKGEFEVWAGRPYFASKLLVAQLMTHLQVPQSGVTPSGQPPSLTNRTSK